MRKRSVLGCCLIVAASQLVWATPDPTRTVREVPIAISAEEYVVLSTEVNTPAVYGSSSESVSLTWYGLEDNEPRETVLLSEVKRKVDRATGKVVREDYWNPSASIAEALTRFDGQLVKPPVRQLLAFNIDKDGVFLTRSEERVDVLSADVLAKRIGRLPLWLEYGELTVVGMHKETTPGEPRYLLVIRSLGRIDDGSAIEVVVSLPEE